MKTFKKQQAETELITSIFVTLTFVVLLIFFVDYYSDIKIKDRIDQVARRYILTLETTNSINAPGLIQELQSATGKNNRWEDSTIQITVAVTHSLRCPDHADSVETQTIKKDTVGTIDINAHYGDTIAFQINGNIYLRTTRWISAFKTGNQRAVLYSNTKATTAKH